MKNKPYEEMSEEELADARMALDEQVAVLRSEKKLIQNEVDKRRAAERKGAGAINISNAGGIESEEKVGKV